MGLFNFAKEAGETLRRAIGLGDHEADARELVQALQQNGVTIKAGRVTVNGDTVTVTGEADNQAEREKAVLILGNTKGVAKVDDQITLAKLAAPAAPAAGARVGAVGANVSVSKFYTVKSGDTLSKIAKEMYGDAGKYPQIFEANKPMLKDPDKIYPGQSLRIPQ
ncbi:MAG: LysM and BON domain-containing protein [Caulobacteraceae bacterium]